MKILKLDSLDKVPTGSEYGVTSFASYGRIVEAMIASGELRLGRKEYVKSVTIQTQGLSFVIEEGTPC